jgi:hypothetical protein
MRAELAGGKHGFVHRPCELHIHKIAKFMAFDPYWIARLEGASGNLPSGGRNPTT